MTDHSDSDSSGLSHGWAVVNAQGELEGGESDSTSSSIEVLDRKAEEDLEPVSSVNTVNPPDASALPQSASSEWLELQQLMKDADTAAASSSVGGAGPGAMGLSEHVASDSVTSPVVSTPHHLSDPISMSASEEQSGASDLRRVSTGEEEAEAAMVSSQPSLDRAHESDPPASHSDQACQTDRASPVLSEGRLSLSSLWSVSSQSSCSSSRDDRDSSSDTSSVASVEEDNTDPGLDSSTDTESDSEFVCLEKEASSSSSSESSEEPVSGSGVMARPLSRSSLGSEFMVLSGAEDFPQSSISANLDSLPPSASQQTSQIHHHHHPQQSRQQQQQPQAVASQDQQQPHHQHHHYQQQQQSQVGPWVWEEEFSSREDQEPLASLPPPTQQTDPVYEEPVETASFSMQDLQPGPWNEREGAVITPEDGVHIQNWIAENTVRGAEQSVAENDTPGSAEEEGGAGVWYVGVVPHIRRWVRGHPDLLVGALVMLVLAFALGMWLGHSSQLRVMDPVTEAEVRSDQHHQDHSAGKREWRLHRETERPGDHTERQRKVHTHLQRDSVGSEKSAGATPPNLTDQDTKRRKPGNNKAWKKEEKGKGKGRGRGDSTTTSTPTKKSEGKEGWRANAGGGDSMRAHLYFSLRDEREIGMNASGYLAYLSPSFNLTAILEHLRSFWDGGRTDSVEGISALLGSGLNGLYTAVNAASNTFRTLFARHNRDDDGDSGGGGGGGADYDGGDGKEKQSGQKVYHHGQEGKKYGQKSHTPDLMEGEEDYDDEDVCVEVEEGFEGKPEHHPDRGTRVEDGEEEEKISTASQAGTGENEHVVKGKGRSDHARHKHKKNSESEDESFHRKKHQKKGRGFINKLFKKAQKAFSRFGKWLPKGYRVKRACPFWSENSAFSNIAARVKKNFCRFSSALKEQADYWFLGNYGKHQKDSEDVHRTVDENEGEVYDVQDEEEFDRNSESDDWGEANRETNHEEFVDEENEAWVEEESEDGETNRFDPTGEEYEERPEEEPYTRRSYHQSRWSRGMNKFLKKTQKTLSRLGHRLQKTWQKVKPTAWPLWSENSVLGRVTSRLKNKIDKFSSKLKKRMDKLSSKLQKKADRWFGNPPKEDKDSDAHLKHAPRDSDAGQGEKRKKSDPLFDEGQHAMPDEEHKSGRNKPRPDETSDVKPKSEKDMRTEGMSNNATKGGMEKRAHKEASKKESEHPKKLDRNDNNGRSSNQRRENQQSDKVNKNEKKGRSKKHRAKEEKSDPQNKTPKQRSDKTAEAEDKKAGSASHNQKKQTQKRKSGKPPKERSDKWEAELDSVHFEQHEDDDHHNSRLQAQIRRERWQKQQQKKKKKEERETQTNWRRERQQEQHQKKREDSRDPKREIQHEKKREDSRDSKREKPQQQQQQKKEKREEGTKSSSSSSSSSSKGSLAVHRAKFRLQSQFQNLFSQVGSMDVQVFRRLSHRDLSRMASEVRSMAQRYSHNQHLGLPVSGSLWLECQQEFWKAAAASHHIEDLSYQRCWRFLTPWQQHVVETQDWSFEADHDADFADLEEEEEDGPGDDDEEEDDNLANDDQHHHVYSDENDDAENADASFDSEDISVDNSHFYDDDDDNGGVDDDEEEEEEEKEGSEMLTDGDDDDLYSDGDIPISDDDTIYHHHPPRKGHREEEEDSSEETAEPWYAQRAQGRSLRRSQGHKARWMFERAKGREETRRQEHAADWVFERAADRDTSRHNKKGEEHSHGRRKQKFRYRGR